MIRSADLKRNKYGRTTQCVYILDKDHVCGVKTKTKWDKNTECFEPAAFCDEHLKSVYPGIEESE